MLCAGTQRLNVIALSPPSVHRLAPPSSETEQTEVVEINGQREPGH